MNFNITQTDHATHIDWALEAVTATMLDWFWSNMEKCFLLWHPEEHEPLTWAVAPQHGNLVGAIHIAPQTWSDGTRQNLYIRFEDLAQVPADVKQYIEYHHCIVVAGLGFGPQSMENPDPLGYRVHQWQATDNGIVGRSSAIGKRKKETAQDGMVWAKHAVGEIGNWAVFLPQLYQLYRAVKNTAYNPFMDLSVTGRGENAYYENNFI
ncbi:MAG: hypothetical protein KIH69_001430 [Anaerolineae bacterium]|nr:hypothetical protein [Anaerolineae bacterium]